MIEHYIKGILLTAASVGLVWITLYFWSGGFTDWTGAGVLWVFALPGLVVGPIGVLCGIGGLFNRY